MPTFATASGESVDEVVADATALVSLGWKVIRILAAGHTEPARYEPREHLAESARRAIAVREALGAEVVLGLEYHHRLSVAEAASFCQRMPSGTLDFLEEPIRDETPEAYEALRRLTDVPFAIGEEFASKWQFLPYIERGIHQYNRIDVCNVGGFTESMKVAGWSEAHYVDLMPHNPLGPICTAATIQFAAAVPNFAWAETWERGTYSGGTDEAVFVARPQLSGHPSRSGMRRASASRSTRSGSPRWLRDRSNRGSRRTCGAVTDRSPTGSGQDGSPDPARNPLRMSGQPPCPPSGGPA